MDWRNISKGNQDRSDQISVRGSGTGIIGAFVDTASGEHQTAKLVYSGGEKSVPLPMPFDSATSWIRSIPEAASGCVVGFRSDTEDPTFLSYINENPKNKLDAYNGGLNLYRPLLPGEHEMHSSGLANSFYSSRPNLEQRAGLIRSWLDQDRLEAGQKAPLHTRQIWEHDSSAVGDEERFGVVRRPMNFLLKNPAAALLALSTTSYNFYDYPYPDFSLPGGVPAVFNLTARAAATAGEVALGLLGQFKKRPFAKEYLKIINNPIFPLPPTKKLIDFREGQVFDDDGLQEFSFSSGAYLRAKYEYYTSLADKTKWTVDELGNVSWDLSLGALVGYQIKVPTGGFSLQTTLDTDIKCLNFNATALLSASINATTDIALESILNTSFTTGLNFDHTVRAAHSLESLKSDTKTKLNMTFDAGVNLEAKAGVKMVLKAPFIDIGASPSSACAMGTELSTWLQTLLNAFVTNAAFWSTGNVGAPTPANPAIVSVLTQLIAQIPTLTSKTIKVSV